MDYNLKNNNIKSSMISYYKTKYKKKTDSNLNNKNNSNALYINDLFNKNNIKAKASLKFRTSKNSPLYTKRKIEVNEEINNGLLTGRIKNNGNNGEDLFSKKIRKLYKKSGHFSQIHNNSLGLINKNESSSIISNKFNKKKLFYNNCYNNNNFDYNIKLNQYIANNSAEDHNININNNSNQNINLGFIKNLENKDSKKNVPLFKKLSSEKQAKNQSMTKIKKISNINYLNSNSNPIDYSKFLKKCNDYNNGGINIINKKLNKMFNPNDYSNSFIGYNKLNKTAYLSKNNSGKNSLDKKNIKNNYNMYCFNSKLIQRNEDKNINNINNNNNNESSKILFDSINNKIKSNINEINLSNTKNTSKMGHNYSQIYLLDNNNNNNILINDENINKIKSKHNPMEKNISLYNYINSIKNNKKHIYHIKSTSDITNKIVSPSNPIVSSKLSPLSNSNNKINGFQNLNSISNNNIYVDINTNKLNNDNNIHFRSNSNLSNNNIINNSNNEIKEIIYKKKISINQKDKHKSSSIIRDKSNSQIENEENSGIKIQSARAIMPKQETIKAKLIKNLLPFSNYQSPHEHEKTHKKIINNYLNDSKKIKNNKLLNKEEEVENQNNKENKSTSLINNNYYIGINLDKKIINNICHTFRENNNYINCDNNNIEKNNNLVIINDITNKKYKNNEYLDKDDNKKTNEKTSGKKIYKHYNSQELIKVINKDLKDFSKPITIEINKKEYHKRKLLDKKIKIKVNKESVNNNNKKDDNDMLYIPPDKQLKQDTIHLTTTTSLDCFYYKNEKEKLSKYIKDYYKEYGVYPTTQKHFYLYGRQIGHGAFGKVNIALHVASGRLVAIKSFNKKNLKKKNGKQKIKNEIEMLSRLRHPFISQILDSFETETHIFIVMEYICGDLLGFIRKRGKLSETVSKIIFKQLIEGLKYIHKKKIVHRDIKLDNILIDLTNTIKICDFGVSRKISGDEIMNEHCGTPAYIAPEIFENQGYSGFKCDIWSAGVTLYYILGGIQPFRASSIKDLEKKVILGDFETIDDISDEANDLIRLMLITDPKKRINEDKILNHPWIASIKTENRKKINLFTDAEKILLSKYDVDYLTSDKEELIENFTNKNLETNENENKKNGAGGTKSVIYAPYNTYIEPNEDQSYYKSFMEIEKIYEEIEVNNDICKYGFKVQQANIKYELSNNQDFDNGIIKTEKEENLKQENEKIENADFKKHNFNEKENIYDYKSKSANDSYEENEIDENILDEIEKTVGYDKTYVLDCLRKNEINYATATYYLLSKEVEDNKKNN